MLAKPKRKSKYAYMHKFYEDLGEDEELVGRETGTGIGARAASGRVARTGGVRDGRSWVV